MRIFVIIGTFAVVLLVVGVVAVGTMAVSPAPLPEGATWIALRTQPPEWRLPLSPHICPLAGLQPVRLVRDDASVAFELIEDGQRVAVVFPHGFAGRLVSGQAELVTPEGLVLAQEGDVLSGLGGSAAENNDFVVCFTSPDDYLGMVDAER